MISAFFASRKGILAASTAFFALFFVLGITPSTASAQSLTPEQRAALQRELQQVEAEEAAAKKQLAEAQNQSASLSRDINVLTARIKAAELDIKAKNLLIQSLGNDIAQKQSHINDLEKRITKGKQTLSDLLRKTNEMGDYSLPEVILSQSSVSGFFNDVDTFQSVQAGLEKTFDRLRADEASTTAEKNALDDRRAKEVDARYEIQQQQKNIQSDQKAKQQLLTVSKSNEKSYTSLLAEKQARAAQIRSALFSLRDAKAIPFGDALKYAQAASAKTGVRPALILAILKQESNLGSNVGSCYLTNTQTGDGINSKSGRAMAKVMNPNRDVKPFMNILSKLGGEPTKTLVSCPLSIGWGGAMGPAQFIASTWVLIEDRVATALGVSTPDPWNPGHAIMASAMYMADRGASAGGYTAERNAACRYYSGQACGAVSGSSSYGNSVMALADDIQRNMINPLAGL